MLAGQAGAAAKARLQGAALTQAMQAFKAALPEHSLANFQMWLRAAGPDVGLGPALAFDSQVPTSAALCPAALPSYV